MRLVAISDVHGNLPALQAVLSAIKGPPDMTIVAGDTVGFGPQPAEVVDLLRARGCVFVKGNVDDYVCHGPSIERLHRFAEQQIGSGKPFRPLLPLPVIAQSAEWSRHQLGEERLGFLSRLPFSICLEPVVGRRLKIVHANPFDLERPIVERDPDSELATLIGEPDCDVLLFGHSHNPFQKRLGATLLVDTASLGFPTDGRPDTIYTEILFSYGNWQVEQHRVAYDTEATASSIRASTMPHKDAILSLLRTARRVRSA